MDFFLTETEAGLRALLFLGGGAVLGFIIHYAAFLILRGVLNRLPKTELLRVLLDHSYRPLQYLLPVLFTFAAVPLAEPFLTGTAERILSGMLHLLSVIGVAWLLIALAFGVEDALGRQFSVEEADNLRARKIATQARILRRIAVVVIIIISIGAVLFEYEAFRSLGTGILASAGIIGIVVGIAAQRTLGNLIAGFQMAFTQPIRVDDVVIVEGDFGWVEEITLTYVVVRVWDQRRIVVPITQFIEKPFQNWTRQSSELLGTVFLYVDHTVPFEEVREALGEIVEASEYYDDRVWRLHVTNTSERTVEMRALMSARSAPDLWELRCEVREKIVAHLQDEYPDALPRVRAELKDPSDARLLSGEGAADSE